MNLVDIAKEILKYKKIGISFHVSPDGDAIGSSLGLLNSLRVLGKDCYIMSREVIPDNLSFLPLSEEINNLIEKPSSDTDLVIILDCGNVERICCDLQDYKGKIINIDHHVSNEHYGYINYIESDSAATCELIYILSKALGISYNKGDESSIKIGTCIYTGILTDTGSFRHSNVTKRTHHIAGELIDCGVKNNEIHSYLFENRPFEKIKLIGETMSNLQLLLDNKVSFVEIPLKLMEKLNLENADTSDIINMALSIKDVEVAVCTKETDDGCVKASLRSKKDIDVSKIAEALGGGGHVKAAGLKLKNTTLNKAKMLILQEVGKEL